MAANQPGQPRDWVRLVVGASVVTVPLLVHGVATLAMDDWSFVGRTPAGDGRYLPFFAAAGLMLVCLVVPSRTSAWVRASVLVPFVHLGVIALAWTLWSTYATHDEFIAEVLATELPMVHAFPFGWVVAISLGVLGVGTLAWTRVRGRASPTWLGSAVCMLLVHLLLVGLWLPILAAAWPEGSIDAPRTFLAVMAGVPVLPAVVFAGIARNSAAIASWRDTLVAATIGALVIATVFRLSTGEEQALAYANGLPALAAEAVVALAAVLILAAAHWRSLRVAEHDARRAAPWTQHGVVETARGEIVGWLRFPTWLHGLRAELRGFSLRTATGVLGVPAGARLVVPIPDSTASMQHGDVMPVLRPGDRVIVTGYVLPPSRGPYRTSATPIPGDGGLIVTIDDAGPPSLHDVLLTVWRPCVLYLIAAGCVALPALAGILPS